MPRPVKCRKVCHFPNVLEFFPADDTEKKVPIVLTVDEYETIRLLDKKGYSQEQCAESMQIARTTVQRIYEIARKKIADALIDGHPLRIEGGDFRICDGQSSNCSLGGCYKQEIYQKYAAEKGEGIMRIAVTYENGQIFQHFGHSESFKIYETEGNNIVRAEVIGTDGAGHSALAAVLKDKGVDVLICGGIGNGAVTALSEAGIDVYSGADGEADAAVEAYLNGDLTSAGVNCDHHHDHEDGHGCGHCGSHEDEESGCGSCGSDEGESDCGSGCGGCGGGCGTFTPSFEGPNVGKKVKVHYKGTLNDGTQFDSSYDRGEPLEFTCGAGMMIQGFDKAVATMNVGDVIDVHLMPEEAYGEADPRAFITLPISELPGAEELKVDDKVYLQNMYGQPFQARVAALTDTEITFDANHEMAGKELNFRIELVEVL